MERLIFIKFGYDDVVIICYKYFSFHVLFLKDDLIERLRVSCCRFAKVTKNSYVQSFKKHYIDYQDLCHECESSCCYDYMLKISTCSFKFNRLSLIKLFEIVQTILIVLILILNGHDCLFSMCFGICYMSGIYFIHWIYYHFVFSKKFQKLGNDLNECFGKLEVILSSLKCREETMKKCL